MEVIQQRLNSSKKADKTSATKQNYAPFISKCPRFQQTKSVTKGFEQKQSSNRISAEHNIKNSVKMTPFKLKPEVSSQCIFKSNSSRFDNQSAEITPSPGDYEVIQKKLKTFEHSPIKPKVSDSAKTRMCTLPTIPDKRNKFGVKFANNEVSFVQKPESILQKQKQLMKMYRQSLSEDTPKLKKSGVGNSHPYTELEKKVKAHLQAMQKQKQNKVQMNRSQSESRIKIHHLYDYHPIGENIHPIPLYAEPNKWQKKGKKTKFQFFDSSEKRFKDLYSNISSVKCKDKASVRQYLHKIAALEKVNLQNP